MTDPLPSVLFADLPPVWPEDLLDRIRKMIRLGARQLVVLDDDPTGTQSVHDVAVVTRWDVDTLQAEFDRNGDGFFILTNSRSLAPSVARKLIREVAVNLRTAAARSGRRFVPVLRGDSTLRGHFPLETDVVSAECGPFDGVILAPFFAAGGRVTIGGVHYVIEDGRAVPVAETPFSKDRMFGYAHSNLRRWVEEKSAGRILASEVELLTLETIRKGGPDAVLGSLLELRRGSHVIVDAVDRRDVDVVALASLQAETKGRRFLLRTAADFVASRFGLSVPAQLPRDRFLPGVGTAGGLIVVGSYVPKTTEQLARLRQYAKFEEVELQVETLLDSARGDALIQDASRRVNEALLRGMDILLFTSRRLVFADDEIRNMAIGQIVSQALVKIVANLDSQPRFLVAKGGITSSDIATHGLGVCRATVLGPLLPGVPVWKLGPEAKFPNLTYVIFPGNVGGPDALADAWSQLRWKGYIGTDSPV